MTDIAPADHRFDLSQCETAKLRDQINAIATIDPNDEAEPPLVELTGLSGQDAACMRWNRRLRIRATGNLGDFAFAWSSHLDVELTGSVGNGVAEGFSSGVIRITGDAGCGAGVAMTSGVLAIYGSAGDRCGAAMRKGSLFVREDVGDDVGIGSLAGTIVIGGDAGHRLGEANSDVTVFIRGNAKSLSPGIVEAPLRKREQVKLGLLLMNASIRGNAVEFRRIMPLAKWQAEEAGLGEVRPNWR